MTTNNRRRLTAVVSTCVLGASLSLVSLSLAATPASACGTTLRAPYKVDSSTSPAHISTVVTNDSCHPDYFNLERLRWFGWQGVKNAHVPRDSNRLITWNCEGTGTYTYRAAWANYTHWHYGPQARLSC
jgi:hypothetical protein